MHHIKFKQLLPYCQTVKRGNGEKDIFADIFINLLAIHNSNDFVEPLEMYMNKYKINGYDK